MNKFPGNKFPRKTFIVARHEFLKTIKRKEFLFMTFLFPFLFAGIILLPVIVSGVSAGEDQIVGYIDMTGSFEFPEPIRSDGLFPGSSEAKNSAIEFVVYSNISDARQALQAGQISSYLVIPEDFLETGTIELYSLEKEALMSNFDLSAKLSGIVITSLLKDKVDETTLNRVLDPVNIKSFNLKKSSDSSGRGIDDIFASFGLPILTAFLLLFSIFSSSGFLLQGVAEEKENRIIEILLSSVTPSEILTGKILGLGAVGLLQIGFWLAAVVIGTSYALPIKIEPNTLFFALVYFVLGFLFFASIMAGIGAVTSSLQESQQIGGILSFAATLPLIFLQPIITNPDSSFSLFLSLFPLTSSVAMLARMAASSVPVYQIFISIFILLVSVYGVILISSRLFRIYLLMYGKKPKVKEILKNIWAESD